MKVINLLNKIANGEKVPEKIKYNYNTYEWKYDNLRDEYCYINIVTSRRFDEELLIECILNNEIEIIEEPKKIEKIKLNNVKVTQFTYRIVDKINEIIDYINEDK